MLPNHHAMLEYSLWKFASHGFPLKIRKGLSPEEVTQLRILKGATELPSFQGAAGCQFAFCNVLSTLRHARKHDNTRLVKQ